MAIAKRTTISPARLRDIESRLLDSVRRSPRGCWEWTGSLDKDGYGAWRIPGFAQLAHRVAFRLFCSDFSEGRCVCHTCDNPRCCNPTHLFIGSDLDNARDRDRKGRGPRGERNHFATLTPSEVLRIRDLAAGGMTQREIGNLFGIPRGSVSTIVLRKSWRHL